jgi:hypothetical protein
LPENGPKFALGILGHKSSKAPLVEDLVHCFWRDLLFAGGAQIDYRLVKSRSTSISVIDVDFLGMGKRR